MNKFGHGWALKEALITATKIENCFVCNKFLPEDEEVCVVYQDDSLLSGFYKVVCSEECYNMYILQNI